VHVVGQVRKGIYPTYEAAYVSPVYVLALSMPCFALGLLMLRRHHRAALHA
jgi:capsular polysaccharide transport system permease protein